MATPNLKSDLISRWSLLVCCVLGLLAGCTKEASPSSTPTSKPAAAAAEGAPRVETAEYAVALTARANGGRITITAKPPLHVNPDYPASFKPEPGGPKFGADKLMLTQEDKKPCAAKAEDTCEATAPLTWEGTAGVRVAGTLQFSVCEPDKCLIEKVQLATTATE